MPVRLNSETKPGTIMFLASGFAAIRTGRCTWYRGHRRVLVLFISEIVSIKHELVEQAGMQQIRSGGQTKCKQGHRSGQLGPPGAHLVVRRRCSPQFLNPNLLELVLSRLLPDERTEATVIVGRERNEAERLQYMVDGAQHLRASQDGAAAGQEHQLDLRSLDDWLRDCKQTPGERNHLEVSPKALSIGQPQHGRSL